MEDQNIPKKRTPRQKTNFEIFKEEKLPLVIAAAAAVLIVIFVIGSICNAVKRNRIEKAEQEAAAQQAQQEKERLDAEVSTLLQQANIAIQQYDYDGALALLAPVSKHADSYPALKQAISNCESAKQTLVSWNDPAQVPNLSFQMLIADPELAFHDDQYASAFNRNYVTTAEFSAILAQLYENGYVLVSLEDVYTSQPSEDGAASYMANTIYLPEGKKPLMLTQTNVNYDNYLIDSDNDGIADKDGCGFASKLMIQDGKPVNEMVDRNGNTVVGEYDLIPILESFIADHPDFSYKGARAVIAVTGHEGLFGYRIAGNDYDQIDQAAQTAQWLRENGYELACYTYANRAYGNMTVSDIEYDLQKWDAEIPAILGKTDILVFAQRSDIGDTGTYAGASFNALMEHGFRYYLGFSNNGTPWSKATTQYVRQGRIMVAGATLAHHSNWFSGMFDASTVLDSSRGTVPSW